MNTKTKIGVGIIVVIIFAAILFSRNSSSLKGSLTSVGRTFRGESAQCYRERQGYETASTTRKQARFDNYLRNCGALLFRECPIVFWRERDRRSANGPVEIVNNYSDYNQEQAELSICRTFVPQLDGPVNFGR